MNNSEIGNLIQQIKDSREVHDLYVPSKKGFVKFYPLSAKQQKNIIESAIKNVQIPVYEYSALSKLIIEQAAEQYQFKLIDREAILVQLRAISIDDKFNINKAKIDLNKIINEYPTIGKSKSPTNTNTHSLGDMSIVCELPDLISCIELDDDFIKSIEDSSNQPFSEILSNMYLNEFIKFIKILKIKDNEYMFSGIRYSDKFKIVENLPTILIEKISKYIRSLSKYSEKFIISPKGSIEVDCNFFKSD
jgi:hypothetical protein